MDVLIGYFAPNCTKELAVVYKNKTLFRNEHNHILTELPTVVPCAEATPIVFDFGGALHYRHESHPEYRIFQGKVETLAAMTYRGVTYNNSVHKGLNASIYSPRVMEEVRRLVRYQDTREPVQYRFLERVMQNREGGTNGYGFGNPGSVITNVDMDYINGSVKQFLSPFLFLLGQYMNYAVAIISLLTFTLYVINVLIRMYHLVKRKGWRTRKLLLIPLEAMFSMVYLPYIAVQKVKKQADLEF